MVNTREACIELLKKKSAELSASGDNRYPARRDFSEDEVEAIKAQLGPWPRALEAAGLKPEREGESRAVTRRRESKKRQTAKKIQKRLLDEVCRVAKEEGLSFAEITETEKIIFDPSFRPYCEENLCGQYGVNYSCPPACGSVDDMKSKVISRKYAMVMKCDFEISDLSDKARISEIRETMNRKTIATLKKLSGLCTDAFMIGAGGCKLCVPCRAALGEECKFPSLRYSCMSAYCINVKALAEEVGAVYDYDGSYLPFFSAIIFNIKGA